MFNKKNCPKCGNKVSGKYGFCPSCGKSLNNSGGEDWGMLGKNDEMERADDLTNDLFGGIGGKMLGGMFNSAMKMLEKEIQKEMSKEMKENSSMPKSNFQLFINGKKVNLGGNSMSQSVSAGKKKQKSSVKKFVSIHFSEEQLKEFNKLKREEPATNLRRLSNKIVYEIILPGVKSMEDISILRLEDSVEIKAISKDKSYVKVIPVKLELINNNFSKDKLLLEFEAKN
jgi:HSP20 family molecular chaperone IbpA